MENRIVEDTHYVNALLLDLLHAAGRFLVAARNAHLEQQPEHAGAVGLLFAQGAQPAVCVEIGPAPRIEAGCMHEGRWHVFFRWAPPADAADAMKLN